MSGQTASNHIPIDVVIPAHQAESTIREAILSAQRQTLRPNEIFVVADACTDRTAEIAESLNVHVIEIDLASVGAARNQGIELGSSPWIAFLDADDLWKESWLENAAKSISSAPDSALIFGRVHEQDAFGKTVATSPEMDIHGDVFDALFKQNFIYTQAVLAKRDEIVRAGFFAEDLQQAEDLDLWLRLAVSGKFSPVSGVHVILRRTTGSLTRTPSSLHQVRNNALKVIGRAAGRRAVSTEQMRSAVANMYVQSAQRFLSFGRRYDARQDLQKALVLFPHRLDWWAMAGYSTLPAESQDFLLRCRQTLRLRIHDSHSER
jgi:glycosyltransferase involved in cell wall biosynthesis